MKKIGNNSHFKIQFALICGVLAFTQISAAFDIDYQKILSEPRVELLKAHVINNIVTVVSQKTLFPICNKELGMINPVNLNNCWKATQSHIRASDVFSNYNTTFENFETLTFKSDLYILMNKSDVVNFLEDLLKSSSKTRIKDLNQWILNHPLVHGSEEKMLQIMAVLFQDPTGTGYLDAAQVAFVKSSENLKRSTELLYQIRGRLFEMQDESNPQDLISQGIQRSKLYHFYVIAYIAYIMTKDLNDPAYGMILPYLFNRTYELGSIRLNEFRQYTITNRVAYSKFSPQWVLDFMSPPNRKSNDLTESFVTDFPGDSLHDIYLGYRGALYGAQLASGKSVQALSRADFETLFKASPEQLTPKLFKAMN